MRKFIFGGVLCGALGTLSLLGGCATVASVEAAQKTADTALTTATAAQASANDAHQAAGQANALAGQAMAAAQSAQNAAQTAQQSADRANAAVAEHGQPVGAGQGPEFAAPRAVPPLPPAGPRTHMSSGRSPHGFGRSVQRLLDADRELQGGSSSTQ